MSFGATGFCFSTESLAMASERTRGGYGLALVGSITLLSTAAAAFALSTRVAYLFLIEQRSLDSIATSQTLPELLQLIWFLTLAAGAGCIVAIFAYDFRALWFWRCLVVASCISLLSPPLHTISGLIALVVLFHTRKAFFRGRAHRAPHY